MHARARLRKTPIREVCGLILPVGGRCLDLAKIDDSYGAEDMEYHGRVRPCKTCGVRSGMVSALLRVMCKTPVGRRMSKKKFWPWGIP